MTEEPGKPADHHAATDLAEAARKRRERRAHWRKEGEPSVMRMAGQIGMLGWMIVTPALLGLFLGRWIDREMGSGIFWTAPLLLLGLAAGCWSAWRWIHRQ
jgi:ATP synthase protein I